MLYYNHGIVALDIINNTTNLKVMLVVGNPMKSAKRAIATDGMKQITRNEDVALEFIVRGFCPTIIQTKPDLIPYFTRRK